MTPAQIIPRILAWTRRRPASEHRTFTTPTGGVLVFDRRMSDADVEAFKALWRKTYKPGAAHPVDVLDEEQQP